MEAWYGWEMCLGNGWLNIIQLYIYNAFITPTAHLKGMKTLREFLTIVCGSRLQFGAIRSKVRLTFWVLKIEAEPGSGRGMEGCKRHGMVGYSVGPTFNSGPGVWVLIENWDHSRYLGCGMVVGVGYLNCL
jgi:hypothetical protein